MREIKTGMTAKSLAGHDKGQEYLVLRAEAPYVYLADGKRRTLERPKKKKQMHVQICYEIPEEIYRILEEKKPLSDQMIRSVLKDKKKKESK